MTVVGAATGAVVGWSASRLRREYDTKRVMVSFTGERIEYLQYVAGNVGPRSPVTRYS